MPDPPKPSLEIKSNPTFRVENDELIVRIANRDFIFTQEQWERFTYAGDLCISEHLAKKDGRKHNG